MGVVTLDGVTYFSDELGSQGSYVILAGELSDYDWRKGNPYGSFDTYQEAVDCGEELLTKGLFDEDIGCCIPMEWYIVFADGKPVKYQTYVKKEPHEDCLGDIPAMFDWWPEPR